MIQRITKDNDITIQLGIDLTNLVSLNIKYFTDKEYAFTVTKDNVISYDDGTKFLFIPSTELSKMNDGQLVSEVTYSISNINFPDGTYDKSIIQFLPLWIYSKK